MDLKNWIVSGVAVMVAAGTMLWAMFETSTVDRTKLVKEFEQRITVIECALKLRRCE